MVTTRITRCSPYQTKVVCTSALPFRREAGPVGDNTFFPAAKPIVEILAPLAFAAIRQDRDSLSTLDNVSMVYDAVQRSSVLPPILCQVVLRWLEPFRLYGHLLVFAVARRRCMLRARRAWC